MINENRKGNPGEVFGYDIDFLLNRNKEVFPECPVEEFHTNLGEAVAMFLNPEMWEEDELDIHDRDFIVFFDTMFEGREEVIRDDKWSAEHYPPE